ncbi:MAG: hypothetical protein K2J00_08030 [Bacteroidaceae bacterium]|nr:hypothetical protein [Bacteroidaceae bacterium]
MRKKTTAIFQKVVLVLALVLLVPLTAMSREYELAELLQQCLLREMVSPDSIEYNLRLLEDVRKDKTGVRRALYTASLAQLYAMRSNTDVTGEWRRRSIELFREALADPDMLYDAPTRDWLPIVKQGKDEKIYGSNMLYVIWQAASSWVGDSVMSEKELIAFYAARGNRRPEEVRMEIQRLMAANDSIWRNAPRLHISMSEVYYPGDSLRMDVDSINIKSVEWTVRDSRGRVVGRNTLTAPMQPGRYTMDIKGYTSARLRRKPRGLTVKFDVSRLQAFVTDMPGGQERVSVVDARSGKPCPEATVLRDSKKNTVRVVLGADSCLPEIRHYGRYNYNPPSASYTPRVAIYTDRAIYRPGQKVMVSAVLYEQKHWQAHVRQGRECSVRLLDRNRNAVADTVARSDEFGTLSAVLSIPDDAELGWYTVNVDGTMHSVRVEEYKRPTFYVELDGQNDDNVAMPLAEDAFVGQGDSIVTVSGRAMNYDGTPLRGARVTTVARRICCWWWRGRAVDNTCTYDTVYTDMEGRFAVSVPVMREQVYRYYPMLRVDVSVLSAQGETQTAGKSMRLFTDPPVEEPERIAKDWLECPADTFDAATPARLEFRNTEGRERYVFLTAFAGDAVVMDTVMVMTDTLRCMDIPYEERYGDGLRLIAVYVSDGVVHSKGLKLLHRLPETGLSIHWDTFRDHTRPGATEQWTMRVYDTNGHPVNANVMLAMYDASLDAFAPNRWTMYLSMNHSIPYSRTTFGSWFNIHCASYWHDFDVWTNAIKNYSYSRLDMQYFIKRGNFLAAGGGIMPVYDAKAPMRLRALNMYELASVKMMSKATADNGAENEDAVEEAEVGGLDEVELRTDFSETAMFMPQLRTDADGRVAISFTLPQSLTTWNLNGIAHTADMQAGVLAERIVARKPLTVKMLLPRFVREKDDMSFTVAINNIGETVQKGKVRIQVMDASTDKVLKKKTHTFSLERDRDTVLVLSCRVPEGLKGLRFRAVAAGAADSDGEQREIPVLSSVVQLTDSRALTIETGENAKVNTSELFPAGAVDRRIIVETVSDPVQTAIDALPAVAVPKGDDVLSYTSAYYAAYKLGLPDTALYINKVSSMQLADGSMPWYSGLNGSAYMTREVGYLLARLGSGNDVAVKVQSGIKRYLLATLKKDIADRKKHDKDWRAGLSDLRTLYVLTRDGQADKETQNLVKTVLKHLPDNLEHMDSEYIAIAMMVKHALKEAVLKDGVKVLAMRLKHSDGTYLAYRGGNWQSIDRRLHIHTQVMEAWQTVCPQDTLVLRGMQRWLLDQKRTQGWKTPVDCIDAVYALTGGDISRRGNAAQPVLRDTLDASKAGTVTVRNDGDGVMWAAVYAEYAMPVELVKDAGMGISLERTFSTQTPKTGDKVRERILIDASRDYEYLVLSIPRAGAVEPVSKLSGCGWQLGVGYYMQVHDDRTDYFIPALPHGKYILDTEFTVERPGEYASGIPVIKCCYAEEFRAHGVNAVLSIRSRD